MIWIWMFEMEERGGHSINQGGLCGTTAGPERLLSLSYSREWKRCMRESVCVREKRKKKLND